MAESVELLQWTLKDWAQKEQLLIQGRLGCCQLGAVYCRLPALEGFPELVLPEQPQLLESYVQLDLLLPLLKACNSNSTISVFASTGGPEARHA